MLDFTELSQDGRDLELVMRELLFSLGLNVTWSGVGPDGGRDLVCTDISTGAIRKYSHKWLVQCKHFAHSRRAVGLNDIDNIVDSCAQHNAEFYMLVSSTSVSSGVVQRIESITNNQNNNITGDFWDSAVIERKLDQPETWAIAQRFFPISAGGDIRVHATTEPNFWVVEYKGHHIQFTSRINTGVDSSFNSIRLILSEIDSIKLPENQFLKIRAIWFNSKSNEYIYYLDFMVPHRQEEAYEASNIAAALGDGWALEDGAIYSFDVKVEYYFPYSDHYDPDHYDYYVPYIGSFLVGRPRPRRRVTGVEIVSYPEIKRPVIKHDGGMLEAARDSAVNRLKSAMGRVNGLRLIRVENSSIEHAKALFDADNISAFLEKYDINIERIFSIVVVMSASRVSTIHNLLKLFPQEVDRHFSLHRNTPFYPVDDDVPAKIRCEPAPAGDGFYWLKLEVHPYMFANIGEIREALNKYLFEISEIIESNYTQR